jgi:hypothetical protein
MIIKFFRKWDFLIFFPILVIIFSGCVTVKNVPPGQLSKIPSWKNLFYFHAEDSTWIVRPVPAAGNQFSGVIFNPDKIKKTRQVHIYAFPLSAVKAEDGKLSVPMENIVKVENFRVNAGAIILAIGVLALLFLIPVYL